MHILYFCESEVQPRNLDEALAVLPLVIPKVAKAIEIHPNPTAPAGHSDAQGARPSPKAQWMAKIMKDLVRKSVSNTRT